MMEADKTYEMIGKIKLDLTHYPGEDFYCDGEIEDTLLKIAKDCSPVEYQKIIEESKSWPILYHLSPLRENIVEWLPIDKSMKVLEVGAGCGAITGALSKKAGSVTCVDLSKKRSMINAYRHMDCDNVTIKVGNFMEVEPDLEADYDYVCLIGVFEYGQAYTGGEHPYEDLLNILKKHCKKDGHIVIAIENKFGLKYWAGCAEDHLGTYFSGLEGYPNGGVVRTFTKRGLEQIADKCELSEYQMFYPYPDYKFMVDLYSDDRLPKIGELKNNMRNFDRDRLLLFDEKLVFDSILLEEEFPLFSNSYMMVIGPKLDITYTRYSNDRAAEYQIKTVERKAADKKTIEKHALLKESEEHVENIYLAGELLKKRFAGSGITINNAVRGEEKGVVSLEYVEGVTLESLLDSCLAKGDQDGFNKLFDEYLERIGFGEEMGVTDYDLIFSNILVQGDVWTVIDYEWTFMKNVPAKEIAFRALYCYILEDEKREKLNTDYIFERLNLTEEEMEELRAREMEFQKMVTGKNMAMGEIREAIGNDMITPDSFHSAKKCIAHENLVQIYEDTGRGFSEENSSFYEETEMFTTIAGGRTALRIDPCSDYCIVSLKEIRFNEHSLLDGGVKLISNGTKLGEKVYAFATKDPGITIRIDKLEQKYENELVISMEVTHISEDMAKKICKKGFFGK